MCNCFTHAIASKTLTLRPRICAHSHCGHHRSSGNATARKRNCRRAKVRLLILANVRDP